MFTFILLFSLPLIIGVVGELYLAYRFPRTGGTGAGVDRYSIGGH